jgi:predicted secreted hydrolase
VKRFAKIFVGLLMSSLLLAIPAILLRRDEPEVRAQLVSMVGETTGFARAEGPRPFDFPADHGPHPDYQTEWWYYTGNLEAEDGRRFGYQLTFFRRALVPPSQQQDRPSNWATDQVYMAHFAFTYVAGGRYHVFERFARGAAGLAGAKATPYRVWLEDWGAEQIEPNVVRLRAAQDDLTMDLLLVDSKGPILQGDGGYSQKGPDPGNASYYYSQTRLDSSGTVQIGDIPYQVGGWSWMDHEFSTSALAPDQVGWDWFALQLDDGSELMVFQIRKADGSADPFSSGTWVAPDGSTLHLSRDDFEIAVGDTWRSPHSGATYPSQWTVAVPVADLTLNIEPYLADQELNVSYTYWEGAVRISGERAGNPVGGVGYVEMTGYAGSMQGQF